MTDQQTPPDWVLVEAAKRSGWPQSTPLYAEYQEDKAYRALCDMIQKYEPHLIKREMLCAREAMQNVSDRGLDEDWWEAIAIRAIELWEKGFGK
jgi:hypothetical protein